MYVLIPAYRPDERLVELVEALTQAPGAPKILIVDDGSGEHYSSVFAAAERRGARVHTEAVNRGKGSALKTGFRVIESELRSPGAGLETVVCADADGQHSVVDILRVAGEAERTGLFTLGRRTFTGPVPLRSRFGNGLTRVVVTLATRRHWGDTQTGLRAFPAGLLRWLQTVPGERYEYEMQQLLQAASRGLEVAEIDIATIYLDHNSSSHFRPLWDSARIYAGLGRFALVSMGSFLLDAALLLALSVAGVPLLAAVVGARLISGAANFLGNRWLVFGSSQRNLRAAAWRYAALAAVVVSANYLLLASLTGLGMALLPAKILTEVTLFGIGYLVQRRSVFAVAATPVDSQPALRQITSESQLARRS